MQRKKKKFTKSLAAHVRFAWLSVCPSHHGEFVFPLSPVYIWSTSGEEAGMEADPEAYKQYYDFYLNYYTHKYARECQQAGGGAAAAATFASQHNNASLESRSDSTLPSAFAVLQNMKQPMQPQSLHRSPAAETATTRRSSGDVRLPQAAINKMNAENARKIADEIRNENKNGGLGLLAAYSDSDSDG